MMRSAKLRIPTTHPCVPELSAYPVLKVPEWSQWQLRLIHSGSVHRCGYWGFSGKSTAGTMYQKQIPGRNNTTATSTLVLALTPAPIGILPHLTSVYWLYSSLEFIYPVCPLFLKKIFLLFNQNVVLHLILFCMCVMVYMWKTEENCEERSILSFYRVRPRFQTSVISLDRECLYLQSCCI